MPSLSPLRSWTLLPATAQDLAEKSGLADELVDVVALGRGRHLAVSQSGALAALDASGALTGIGQLPRIEGVRAAAFDPLSRKLAVSHDGGITAFGGAWDGLGALQLSRQGATVPVGGHELPDAASSVAFFPEGGLLAVSDGKLRRVGGPPQHRGEIHLGPDVHEGLGDHPTHVDWLNGQRLMLASDARAMELAPPVGRAVHGAGEGVWLGLPDIKPEDFTTPGR